MMTEKIPDAARPLRVVALCGALHAPSKTGVVVDAVLRALGGVEPVEPHVIDVLQHGHALIDALDGTAVVPALAEDFERVANADLLIVATPVYKGSYTGLLKLFVDFLPQDDLVGLPVLPVAVGGSDVHSLVIDHELRPLFGFFRAPTLPAGVWAKSGEVSLDGTVTDALSAVIDGAISAGLPVIRAYAARS